MLMAAKADPRQTPGTGVASPLQLARRDPSMNAELLSLFEMGIVEDPATKGDLLSLFEMGYVKDPQVNDADPISLFATGYAGDHSARDLDRNARVIA